MNGTTSLTFLLISTLLLHGFPDFRIGMSDTNTLTDTLRQPTTTSAVNVLSGPALTDSFFDPARLVTPTVTPAPSPTATPTPSPTPAPTRVPLGTTQAEHAGDLTYTYPEAAPRNTDTSTYTLLVNKEYPLPANYIPYMVEPDVPIYHKGINERRYLQPVAASALETLFAAAKEDGYELVLRCGFRSYNLQKSIYTYHLKQYGYYEVSRYHALPGTSEHQTGLAVDLCCKATNYQNDFSFLDTKEYLWLLENAHTYGWILRYPEGKTDITGYNFEPWHFRYVGVELATYLTEQDITLEEYYGALPTSNLLAIPEEYWGLMSKKDYALMLEELDAYQKRQEEAELTPEPTLTPTDTPELTPSPELTPADTPELTPEPELTPADTPEPTPSPELTPTDTQEPMPSPPLTPPDMSWSSTLPEPADVQEKPSADARGPAHSPATVPN